MHTGGCLCGQVRYEMKSKPAMTMVCHCRHCQRQTGASFSILVGIAEDAFDCSGTLKTFADTGMSGGEVERQFCPECGSPILSRVANAPGMIFIKAGTLDDPSSLAPKIHIWTGSKQPWVPIAEGAIQIVGQPVAR